MSLISADPLNSSHIVHAQGPGLWSVNHPCHSIPGVKEKPPWRSYSITIFRQNDSERMLENLKVEGSGGKSKAAILLRLPGGW